MDHGRREEEKGDRDTLHLRRQRAKEASVIGTSIFLSFGEFLPVGFAACPQRRRRFGGRVVRLMGMLKKRKSFRDEEVSIYNLV